MRNAVFEGLVAGHQIGERVSKVERAADGDDDGLARVVVGHVVARVEVLRVPLRRDEVRLVDARLGRHDLGIHRVARYEALEQAVGLALSSIIGQPTQAKLAPHSERVRVRWCVFVCVRESPQNCIRK